MAGSVTNRPRILHGAFVEFGSSDPLTVVFQFNPVELARSRSLSFQPPSHLDGATQGEGEEAKKASKKETGRSLREYHQRQPDLGHIQKCQKVNVAEETISFDIRLDATDKLGEGDPLACELGIAPQLATLELMVLPKSESVLRGLVDELLGRGGGYSFSGSTNPPLVLFIWGRRKVLPVNINALNVKESEFSIDLNPIRATVSVNLTVIEGQNSPHAYSKLMTEAMSVVHLATTADVVIPA